MLKVNDAPSLGTFLRALRQGAVGSLDEMARTTRISQQYLRALEADDFSQLPAPVFVRGFIRAYCGFLGASADRALAMYQETLGLPSPEPHPVLTPRRASWLAHPIAVSAILLVVFGAGGGNRACRARALGQCADTLRAGGKWAHLLRADGGKSAHRGHLNTGNGACHAGAAGGRSRARRAGARGRSRHAAPRRQGRGGDLDSRTDRRRPRRRGTARGRGQAGVDLGQTLPPDGGQRGWRGGGVQRPAAPLARRPGRRHPTPVASRIPHRLVSFLRSLTDRVRQGLQRTRDLMDDGLDALLAVGRPIDDALLDEIEEALIAADL